MTLIARIAVPTVADTERVAAALAGIAVPGDIFALSGALGTGKTTFARGFVQTLTGTDEDVPSPTFTLVQTYDTPKGKIWHCDLYRLAKPGDAEELGLDEAFASAICLIEWPERLGALLPAARLAMSFTFAGSERAISLEGDARWQTRLAPLIPNLSK
ncbi:MAG: tRNA (adenosine(37)-N6)-threonylcarbamoyltransferase complex ATPase subunit type 1 TsaE [Rhodospirillaceae bacterium]|nr:tRNA (adenosine(37)-N6)-threonylcarbamoyltransferase complex ATPase subunit type 1 TsaE [Rhodospirillaceae bacterium]